MRTSGFGRYVLISCVAVAMLAGCGRSQQLPFGSADTTPARLQERPGLTASTKAAPTLDSKSGGYKVTPPLLYVANATHTDDGVNVFRATGKDRNPLVTITDGVENPAGVCIDSLGTLYVTNDPNSRAWLDFGVSSWQDGSFYNNHRRC